MTNPPHRIDVHHHILPPEYVTALAALGVAHGGDIAFPAWSKEAALSYMDRKGIATAVTSISAPGVHFGDVRAARDLARRCNEISARLVADHPTRFGAFAILPLPDVDGALDELRYALDTLKLDGVVLLASAGEQYLGDSALDAVFAELNRRRAVAFVHPAVPVTSLGLNLTVPGAMCEFVFDTTRAVANMIYSGTLERCPDISIILSHAGGTIPFIAWRIGTGRIMPKLNERAPKGANHYLKRLYYDTAMSGTAHALSSLSELVDSSHILFGRDYPFLPEPLIAEMIQGVADYRPFDAAARRAIDRDSALALFPRLRALTAEPA